MDFRSNAEFQRKYTAITLRRGKLCIWVTFFISWYGLYADLLLKKEDSIDYLYRQNLVVIHVIMVVLSVLYIIAYGMLERSKKYRLSGIARVTILSHAFLTLLIAAVLAINSQRFTGNIDVYILAAFAVAVAVPIYPKWMLGIYGIVHLAFLIALSSLFYNNSILTKQFNSTAVIVVALILYLMLYRYNGTTFLNEQMLKEDKATFIKLFETNPFPLMISRFSDGKVVYANQKALLFYEIPQDGMNGLNHKDFYKNAADLNHVHQMLETSEKVDAHVVELKTATGKIKCPVVNYEVVDYFGEKSILSGIVDISEIKRIEQELTVHASTDSLTGVLNRRVGMDRVRGRYDTVGRENDRFTLCFIDIDNLKEVNDRFGHLEGDSLIVTVCRIIGEEIAPEDVLFRYGGDEFMILFADEDEGSIHQVCRSIAGRYDELNRQQHKPYSINASMGTFTYQPEMNLSLEQVIEIVDRNMYNNKLKNK